VHFYDIITAENVGTTIPLNLKLLYANLNHFATLRVKRRNDRCESFTFLLNNENIEFKCAFQQTNQRYAALYHVPKSWLLTRRNFESASTVDIYVIFLKQLLKLLTFAAKSQF
jgi:hypothetical protein